MKRNRKNIFTDILSKLHLGNPKVIWGIVIASALIAVAVVIGSGKIAFPRNETAHSNIEDVEFPIEDTVVEVAEDDNADNDSRQEEISTSTPKTVADVPEPATEEPEHVEPAPTPKPDVEIAREVEKETSIVDSFDRLYSMGAVEQRPSFPGGENELIKYLSSHINYPTSAAEDGISGRVIVKFVISKDGSISDVEVIRSRHPALDAEAVRLVRSMPRWIPGKINGQPVNVSYSLPVTFRLS